MEKVVATFIDGCALLWTVHWPEKEQLTGRLLVPIVGPSGRPDPGYVRLVGRSDQSDRPVGQTVAEPPTSVNQINVAC